MQLVISLLFLTLLSGCLHNSAITQIRNKPLLQLPTYALQKEISVVQKVTAHYEGHQHSFIAQLEITKNKLVMVGLTEFGARLFTLIYDNETIHFESTALLKTPMAPEFLLSDLQLIYWPESIIESRLMDGNKIFQNKQAPFKRQLFIAEQEVIVIDYSDQQKWKGSVFFQHRLNKYNLAIQTLDINEL